MEADTPKRCATAPTFSASPTFLVERVAFFLRAGVLLCELEEALDKGVSTWPWMGCLLSEYTNRDTKRFQASAFASRRVRSRASPAALDVAQAGTMRLNRMLV